VVRSVAWLSLDSPVSAYLTNGLGSPLGRDFSSCCHKRQVIIDPIASTSLLRCSSGRPPSSSDSSEANSGFSDSTAAQASSGRREASTGRSGAHLGGFRLGLAAAGVTGAGVTGAGATADMLYQEITESPRDEVLVVGLDCTALHAAAVVARDSDDDALNFTGVGEAAPESEDEARNRDCVRDERLSANLAMHSSKNRFA